MTDAPERNARHLLSVVTPVYDPPREAFEACVRSVLTQDYDHWEWCLADDCSPAPWVWPRLQELAAKDPRIKVTRRDANGGISAATNSALELATGEFVVLLDNDDQLTPDALGAINHELWIDPTIDYLYSDEDKVDDDGNFFDLFEKPDWSPERLLCQNYCSHLSALRRSIVTDVGGFRPEYDGAQDYDMVLRVTERARKVAHVQRVLYHWRAVEGSTATSVDAKPYAVDAGQRAVADALQRRGVPGEVVDIGYGYHRVRRELTSTPKVSIIVPTTGHRRPHLGPRPALRRQPRRQPAHVDVPEHRSDRRLRHRDERRHPRRDQASLSVPRGADRVPRAVQLLEEVQHRRSRGER